MGIKDFLNNHERKYIIYAAIFAVIYFGFLQPYLINKGIENSNPYFQFILFNIGLFIFFQIFLKAITLKQSLEISLGIGLTLLFTAIDVWAPPFAVDINGTLIETGTLIRSSSDYILGYFATNTLHLSGIFVYLFTYLVGPLILLIIAAKLIPNFVRSL